MSLPINITSAITFIPATSGAGQYAFTTTGGTASGITNAYTNADSTTAARLTIPTTTNRTYQAYFNYDLSALSDIPSDATIDSVSARVKYSVSTTNANRVSAVTIQLYTNTTAKGSAVTTKSTSAAVYNITAGNWTLSELQNARLSVQVTRGSQTNASYLYFYGSDLTVNYTVNEIAYEVNVTNNSTLATVSPTYASGMTGEDFTISFDGIVDKSEIVVKDNNVDVTNSLVPQEGGSGTGNFIPSEYVSSASSYDSIYTGSTSDGLADSGSTSRICVYANTGANAVSKLTYKFNCSSIPQDATITNVTCVAGAACYSNGQYFATRTLQLYNGSTAKGTATTITGNGGTKTNETINGGSWTREDLNDISLVLYIARGTSNTTTQASFSFWGASLEIDYVLPGDGFQYTISNISADHTIVVTDNASIVKHTVNASSSYAGATVSPATQQVIEGRNATVEFEVGHLYEITVKDNGTVVTPTEAVPSTNVSFIPSSFVESASTFSATGTTNPPSNGLANTASTTYATFTAQTVANAIVEAVYKFDCSSIPANAVIDSVTCSVYCRTSSATYLPTAHLQLYHGNTAKGSQSANVTGTASVRTFDGGAWTREELNDVSVHFVGQRGTSTSAASLRFYGANLSVTYHVPCAYTITNVQADHTITVEEGTYYTISTTNTYANASVSASQTKVYSGSGVNSVITLMVPNLYEVVVKDGNTDITNSFVGSNGTYTYTLTNINANHTISVTEAQKHLLTASSKYGGVTISPSSVYVYNGQAATFTLQGSVAKIVLKDNDVDVTSSIIQSGNNYLYTISNISQEHEVIVYTEADYVKVSGTYKEVKKFFKKVNGDWQEITKTQFDTQLSEQVLMYGGHFTGATVVGEVVKSQNAVEIVLNDNALEPGTYKFVYEDAGKEPLDNVDEITQFTIS